jgi:hypothetical protein
LDSRSTTASSCKLEKKQRKVTPHLKITISRVAMNLPFTVSLLNGLKPSTFDRRQFLSVGTSGACNRPRTIHGRKFRRNEANLLDGGDLLALAGFCHLAKEGLHLSPPFDQRSFNANVIGILIPKVVQSADIPFIEARDCLIHHASDGPFVSSFVEVS